MQQQEVAGETQAVSNAHNVVKVKVALLELAKELGNVSKACRLLGYSRDSFYRFRQLYQAGGEDALETQPRTKPNMKNRVVTEIENQVLHVTLMQPLWGQVRVARDLRRRGIPISPSGVRCVWVRHELETVRKRFEALAPRKTNVAETVGEFAAAREPVDSE